MSVLENNYLPIVAIQRNRINSDGRGVRTLVHSYGCNLSCKWCCNPETRFNNEFRNCSAHDLLEIVKRDDIYFLATKGGVTFSGGEPLLQLDFLIEFAKLAKQKNINIAIDTCGQPFTNEKEYLEKFDILASLVDLFIVDIKCFDNNLHKEITGHTNSNIFDMLKHLDLLKKDVWIRHVLVPNLTGSKEDLLNTKQFLNTLNNVRKVEVLPYHDFAIFKYKNLGIKYPLEGYRVPTAEEVKTAENILEVEKYK